MQAAPAAGSRLRDWQMEMEDIRLGSLTQRINPESSNESDWKACWSSQPCSGSTRAGNDTKVMLVGCDVGSCEVELMTESKPIEEEQCVPGSIEEWTLPDADTGGFLSFSQPPTDLNRNFWLTHNAERFLTQPTAAMCEKYEKEQLAIPEELSRDISMLEQDSWLVCCTKEDPSQQIPAAVNNTSTITSSNTPANKDQLDPGKNTCILANCSMELPISESHDVHDTPLSVCPPPTEPQNDSGKSHQPESVNNSPSSSHTEVNDITANDGNIIDTPVPLPPTIADTSLHPLSRLSQIKFSKDVDSASIFPVFTFDKTPQLLSKETLLKRLSNSLEDKPANRLPPELELKLNSITTELQRNRPVDEQTLALKCDDYAVTSCQPACKKLKTSSDSEGDDVHIKEEKAYKEADLIEQALLKDINIVVANVAKVHAVPCETNHCHNNSPPFAGASTNTTQSLTSCLMTHRAQNKATGTPEPHTLQQKTIMNARSLLGVPHPNLNYNLSKPKLRVGLSRRQTCPSLHSLKNK